MNNILLKNNIGESVTADVVKYFKYDNETYMIYTLNEIDSDNYIKLYAIKLTTNEEGEFVGTEVDNSVWGNIVALIKEMVKPVSERINNDFDDLNSSYVTTINLLSKRVFKINKDMSDLLIRNTEIKDDIRDANVDDYNNISTDNYQYEEETTETEQNINNDNEMDYKMLYEEELKKNSDLTLEIEDIKSKLFAIENIIKG